MVYSYIYRTAYDITLVDDHWPQDMFNVVSGNTSQSWERLHAWVPSCNNGRLSYLYHSLVNFSHHILQWWSSVTLFWIGRQSERIVFGLSSCHYIPHPHKGCLAGLLFIQSIFSFLFLAFLHQVFYLLTSALFTGGILNSHSASWCPCRQTTSAEARVGKFLVGISNVQVHQFMLGHPSFWFCC